MIFTRNELAVLETVIHDTQRDKVTSRDRIVEATGILGPDKIIHSLSRRGYIKAIEQGAWLALKALDGSYIQGPLGSRYGARRRTPMTPRPDIPFVTKK